ncbi:hypothetical protein D0863_06736 [Hortaea werneckii]|uniref:Sensitive to high expression protein 9, mitochondrial n=1 Tax=Hortaea werneckii TaxID=91943 RepID=A0A3M7DXN4_HORWE|nr:hypothetical protein D0863_06736 [Hortaea werneckii]
MQSTTRHGARLLLSASVLAKANGGFASSASRQTPWTCAECRLKLRSLPLARNTFRQTFSTSRRRLDDGSGHKKPIAPTANDSVASEAQPVASHNKDETDRAKPSAEESPAPITQQSSLPSHAEGRRWQMSKDMTQFIDHLLARASVAGQHINAYTGTDYSGIEVLRNEIKSQELKVKDCHRNVDLAKDSHTEAYQKQSGAQKEIVGLLERKSSWSPADLERYMNLVRSEHVHDQAVQAAKDALTAKERELEEARAMLERLERKQYHEEQIWSDTIRRNSTWVTFGLMGFNIVLLLAQILIFEPYRRRKIVREVKVALDEKTVSAPAAEAEKQIDEVVEPSGKALETIETPAEAPKAVEQPIDVLTSTEDKEAGETSLAAGEVLPEEASNVVEQPSWLVQSAPSATHAPRSPWNARSWDDVKDVAADLFSERLIQIKQVDLTTLALQSAAAGFATMGVLFLALRSR